MPEDLTGIFRTTRTNIMHFAQWGLLFCRTLYIKTCKYHERKKKKTTQERDNVAMH